MWIFGLITLVIIQKSTVNPGWIDYYDFLSRVRSPRNTKNLKLSLVIPDIFFTKTRANYRVFNHGTPIKNLL